MKKKTIQSKLRLNKNVISRLQSSSIKGGNRGDGNNDSIVSPGTTVSLACTVATCPSFGGICDD